MSAAPHVSIGLPVYDGEQYLASALESILGQTYTDFELVVGDNGSTDATREIVAEFVKRDARVRVLESDENRGAAWNYNRVFHASHGEYFRWAAYDDLLLPTYLERLVETLDAAPPTTVLAQTLTTLIDEHGNDVGVWDDRFDLTSLRPSTRLRRLVKHLVMSNVFFGLVRRSAMERTRLHGTYPSADYVFLAELALLGTFATVPERLFLRRVHPGMSRYAHTSLAQVAEWFEPGSGARARPELLRLLAEHLRAIRRSPIGLREEAVTVSMFLPVWFARHRGAMATELRSMTSAALRGDRASATSAAS